MAGVNTSNILQPGIIAQSGGINRDLVSTLQLLTPQYYRKYVEKYGNEDFTGWLMAYSGQEVIKNRNYFWFENRGKNMQGVTTSGAVTTTAGSTISGTITAATTYSSQSPLRVGETFRVASTNTEYVILTVPTVTTFTARPKQVITETIASGEVLLLAGMMDVGEASDSATPQTHLDARYENNITEIHDTWGATDLADMAEVFYDSGVSGSAPAGSGAKPVSMFTYKGLLKFSQRYLNLIDEKLMRGGPVTNTGLLTTTSVGSQGMIPKVIADGETVGYTAGSMPISKLHEITRVMDVNGCANEALWLMDMFQRQDFTDGIFAQFPAGSWVWGESEKSQEAAIAYGVQSILIDGYMLKVKKYSQFNTEKTRGLTPTTDYFRNFGMICPQGSVSDSKGNSYKNVTLMMQEPPKGGTTGNGIRVYEHGGASGNPTNGVQNRKVEMTCYKSIRVAAANQFIVVPSV